MKESRRRTPIEKLPSPPIDTDGGGGAPLPGLYKSDSISSRWGNLCLDSVPCPTFFSRLKPKILPYHFLYRVVSPLLGDLRTTNFVSNKNFQ